MKQNLWRRARQVATVFLLTTNLTLPTTVLATDPENQPPNRALFGDLHVHSALSNDAYILGVRTTPEDAYRYAKGEAIVHPLGFQIQLQGGALDFYAVTDHAEYLGVLRAMGDPKNRLSEHPLAKSLVDQSMRSESISAIASAVLTGMPIPDLDGASAMRSSWQRIIDAAEQYNEPGNFTTFIAYEYGSMPGMANLHRNVIFAGSKTPAYPFGALDSVNPENLWRWMDDLRSNGIEALAIPHNANWSQGLMFQQADWVGRAIDAEYAARRIRNEPLIEVTQVKGNSETHPLLSPTDEWADFEIWKFSKPVMNSDGSSTFAEGATTGAYARDALLSGLSLQAKTGINPYQFGLIGSSDGHNAASPVEENNFFGKLGVSDGSAITRRSVPSADGSKQTGMNYLQWSASGLAGVWAEENSRDSIYAALRRKEVFATSGPRIQLRFFAGYDFGGTLIDDPNAVKTAYARGASMGDELLLRADETPEFFVWATRDPKEAPLQRAQIIKGWISNGETHERVFDVVCSDGLSPDPETHRCPDNAAGVNLNDCSLSPGKGAAELRTVWRDPTFAPDQEAFYYLRVLQNPSCRWSTWDAIRAGIAPTTAAPATIQERAWSSPIWFKRWGPK